MPKLIPLHRNGLNRQIFIEKLRKLSRTTPQQSFMTILLAQGNRTELSGRPVSPNATCIVIMKEPFPILKGTKMKEMFQILLMKQRKY